MDFRELFRCARLAAEDLERCTRQIAEMRERAASPGGGSTDSIHVSGGTRSDFTSIVDAMVERETRLRLGKVRECEAVLDAAWEAVGIVSADLSDTSAQVLSEHYLFGRTWDEVARSIGRCSRTTSKHIAWAALDWLDESCIVIEKQNGVGVRRKQ